MSFKKSVFKKIYQVHVFLGVLVALHFALFSLSGLVLLFKDEIQNVQKPTAEESSQKIVLSASDFAFRYGVISAHLKEQYPSDRLLALFPDEENQNVLNARLGIDGVTKLRGARKAAFSLESGKESAGGGKVDSGFFDWMLRLHREVLLGSNGKLYVGFIGVLYSFMLLSGFFLYGNFMKGRSFGDLRKMRIPQLVDLHKFAGVVTFGWSLVVGVSGVFLAFNGVLIKLFQFQSLRMLSAQYPGSASLDGGSAPLTQIVGAALAAKRDSVISYISFPDTEFGIPGHFLVLTKGAAGLTKRISELLVVNAQSAELVKTVELPWYLKIVLLSEPLHFGDYGGLFLKVIWALFTLGSLAVAALGVTSFVLKRRKKRTTVSAPSRHMSGRQRGEGAALIRSRYALPVFLAVLIVLGLLGSLFGAGVVAKMSVGVLLIPLFVLLFGGRSHV